MWSKKRGDDLSSFRNTIISISKTKKPILGIEAGRSGLVIRGLAPIFDDNNKYLGDVESIHNMNNIYLSTKNLDKEDIAVYMDKKLLPITSKFKMSNIVENAKTFKDFIFVSKSDNFNEALVTNEFFDKGKIKPTSFKMNDLTYMAFPLHSFNGETVAVMVYQLNVAEINADIRYLKLVTFIPSLLLLLIGVFLLWLISGKSIDKINVSIEGLADGAHQVTSASTQVAQASQELAESANEQASSLEETSASLEEFTSMIKQNTDSSNHAQQLASDAKQAADLGFKSMLKMTDAISEIKKSSDETFGIVKTIEEIAFQTNLLALNAAVEAARAGDAGKGFAVVAEEVRSLAQRSAEAAKSTASLITNSVENANNGVSITKEVVDVLNQISEGISKVNDIATEIASASNEQSKGIEQINITVAQMNKVTQQNAANSEEGAASAEELGAQASEVMRFVDDLKRMVEGVKDSKSASQISTSNQKRIS